MLKVFVDLDGVLSDFMVSVHKWYGLPYSYEDYPYEIGSWDCLPPESFKGSVAEFWGDLPPHFWSDLEWTPDGKSILKKIEEYIPRENIYLFTARNMKQSAYGAVAWVAKNIPDYRNKLIIGSDKGALAHSDALLIDDANHNIDAFIQAGGCGILVPRKWNRLHDYKGTAVEHIEKCFNIMGVKHAGLN